MSESKNNTHLAFFIIPGNPPASYFYELWKSEILQAAPQSVGQVAQYPYLPHDINSEEAMELALQSIEQQLIHFSQQVGRPVTILAHSLGGHFAYELLKRSESIIEHICLLHPFLRMPTYQGQKILQTLRGVQGQKFLRATILKSRSVLKFWIGALTYITPEELKISLALAYHEHYTLGINRSPLEIQPALRHKIKFFYIPKDMWCAPAVVEALRSQVESTEVQEPHAFIASPEHRQSLMDKIFKSLPEVAGS